MKRFVSLHLPRWATERRTPRNDAAPLALIAAGAGGVAVTAMNAAAEAAGVQCAMKLADARLRAPHLKTEPADPAGDARALDRLVAWCRRYTPFAASDGADGVSLDITGCAHLFGGEAALGADLTRRLGGFGVTGRAAAAATPGAAWAWARFGATPVLEKPAELLALPVEALRLSADKVSLLRRLGLDRIGRLTELPRAPLAARFGRETTERLDRVFGAAHEPISPLRRLPRWRARLSFPDGIVRREDLDAALEQLLGQVCALLDVDGRGARRLVLALYRLDGGEQSIAIGVNRPSCDIQHLLRLFGEKMGGVDPGFGIETLILDAATTDTLAPRQADLDPGRADAAADLAAIVDRLEARLGRNSVTRLIPVSSHWPERAAAAVPAFGRGGGDWMTTARPLRLLDPAEPIDVTGEPDRPPRRFIWRRAAHHVTHAVGPERLAPEWWRHETEVAARDYFRVEDSEGRRYWIYREDSSHPSRWRLHGLFA